VAIACFVVGSVLLGFAPSYFLRPFTGSAPGYAPLTPLVHSHGAVFASWTGLFAVQVGLVSADRRDVHRSLGFLGLGLVIAMLFLGWFAAIGGVARASGSPGVAPHSWLAVPLISLFTFAPLFLLALRFRHDVQAHKRLMVLGMCAMLSAAFGRMPMFSSLAAMVLMPDLPLIALLAWDVRSLGRPHPATGWGGALVLFGQVTPSLIWNSDAWLAVAQWLAPI